jgi:hypothetical protein
VDHDEDEPRFYETEKMRYCAIGAIFAAAGKEEESRAHELIRELDFLVSEYTDGQFDCVVDFNDESNDKRRVVKMFKRMLRKKKAEAGIPIELPESRKDSADSGAVTEQEEPVSV